MLRTMEPVDITTSVAEFKLKLEVMLFSETNMTPSHPKTSEGVNDIRLAFKSVYLVDTKPLESYGLKDGNIIRMLDSS